jgi:DNA-binding beta-propeller fold protein YncE
MNRIVLLSALLSPFALFAQTAPHFEVDATWPKPLPDNWITGQLSGVCVDSHDHVVVVNRRNITKEEAETSTNAPSIIMFDAGGNVVKSWGDPNVVPDTIHGCSFDKEDNVWVAGNGDGIVQKYSHDGKLLLQIGTRGVVDSADGTGKGKPLNSAHDKLYHPANVVVDSGNGDLYIADGYGNRRIAVFDKNGKYLRQWGSQATKEQTQASEPGVFAQLVHCVAMGKDGLIYVCDRQSDRVQVFDKQGKFVKNIPVRTGTPELPDPRGTVWWISFSPDPQEKHMYVMDGRAEQVRILDHETGKILASFGRPGHQLGNFTHGHTMAVDSKGNIYIAETDIGRRVQRFKPVSQ